MEKIEQLIKDLGTAVEDIKAIEKEARSPFLDLAMNATRHAIENLQSHLERNKPAAPPPPTVSAPIAPTASDKPAAS